MKDKFISKKKPRPLSQLGSMLMNGKDLFSTRKFQAPSEMNGTMKNANG